MAENPLWALTQAANQAANNQTDPNSRPIKEEEHPAQLQTYDRRFDFGNRNHYKRSRYDHVVNDNDRHPSISMAANGQHNLPRNERLPTMAHFCHPDDGPFIPDSRSRMLQLDPRDRDGAFLTNERRVANMHQANRAPVTEQPMDDYARSPPQVAPQVVRPWPRRQSLPGGQSDFQPHHGADPMSGISMKRYGSHLPQRHEIRHDREMNQERIQMEFVPELQPLQPKKRSGSEEKLRQKKRLRNEAEKKRIRKESDTIALLRSELALHVDTDLVGADCDPNRMSRQAVLEMTLRQLNKLRGEYDGEEVQNAEELARLRNGGRPDGYR